ncbi:MAG TPA: histidine--tRNA ligase [Bacteroidia bacterium]|nr:histidine--tRNA ligase [Bacteroidia bacterium]HRS59390.1 histidine--tRNA ligase [Bacteroidia bacterium]HRU68725.1 histidine--tRNA ligase [Bacteroidia bacterium]
MIKPGTPRGFRDFGPNEMAGRDFIFNTIKDVFRLYGYQPIETPAMELISTLTGKYGEEGDKLMFRVLNSGDFLQEAREKGIDFGNHLELGKYIAEKGMRYDLTVPFARFVVEHYHELNFPFKRFQIQPVWRADRPQKGRYREFYQCDVDVIGSDSLFYEFELISVITDIFERLGIHVSIRLNNRKLLMAIAESVQAAGRFSDLTIAIDKLEKIGLEAVVSELAAKGFSPASLSEINEILQFNATDNIEKLRFIEEKAGHTPSGKEGIAELREILGYCSKSPKNIPLEIDLKLARGLNYYTGAIIEVKAKDVEIGSICGGGRYDNLTGVFGLPGLSGVGVSFGADRIYDVMKNLSLFPHSADVSAEVLIVNFGEEEAAHAISLLADLHGAGISAEIYPETAKLKKQFSYASAKKIRFVMLAGKDEIAQNIYGLKDLSSAMQYQMSLPEIIHFIKKSNA